MAKESSENTPKELSKKHLAKVEKENRQKKFLLYGIIAVIVVIVGLIVYGVLKNTVLKDVQPVAKVGDTTITVKQFEDRVRYDRFQQVQTFETYASSYFATLFQDQLLNIQNNLDSYVNFGSNTLDEMIGEAAVVQKAKSMGITVTDQEVEDEIQSQLQYFPKGTPTATAVTPTVTYYPTSTLSALQNTLTYATNTPTGTAEATATPAATDTPAATETGTIGTPNGTESAVTPAASDTPAGTATATLESTATIDLTPSVTPSITPTATEYTYAGYQQLYSTVIANIATNGGFTEQELRDYIRTILYERKIYAKLTAEIAPEQDMVWARHILVADEATAEKVEKLLKDGGDWNSLAAQYSTDASNSANGGDLGWFIKGTMLQPFEDAAWSMKIGQISDPIKTTDGYHIIQVLGHEKRQLTSEQLSNAQSTVFQKFIDDAKTELGVKKYDIWASVVPTDPTIPAEYRISSGTTTP